MTELQQPAPKLSQHPLMGVRLGNLLNLLSQQKLEAGLKWPLPLIFAASALARAPFSWVDRWKAARRRGAEKLEAPVFIVGYWRSGTTHLHNLLAQSPGLGIITPLGSGLPDELLTLGTWLRPLLEKGLPDDRGVDDVAVTPRSPQEDEIPLANLQPLSVFHALYFPAKFKINFNRGVFFDGVSPARITRWKDRLRYFLGKVALQQRQQPLLIKNPVHTTRINLLRSIWPEARFIHIHRNPYRVYRSTMYYYPEMLHELALQPYDWQSIKPVIVKSYPRMLNTLYESTADLPENKWVEVRFEDLEKKPLMVLKRIYDQLGLPGWNAAETQTKTYLDSIAHYRKNNYKYKASDLNQAEKHWGEFIDRWGYNRPKLHT